MFQLASDRDSDSSIVNTDDSSMIELDRTVEREFYNALNQAAELNGA